MTKSLLIFDLDGTLIDSVPDLTEAVNASLVKNGLPTHSTDVIRTLVGNGAYALCQRAVDMADDKHPDDRLINQVHHDFLAYYEQHTCIKSTPYDGVHQGLSALKLHGHTLAIATNKPVRFLPSILAHFGWQSLFDCVVGDGTLPTKKPDPAPLLYICNTLGFTPAQALMIGDSKNDIIAGKQACISTIALTYGYNYNEPITNSNPDYAFDRFGQMVDYLITQ